MVVNDDDSVDVLIAPEEFGRAQDTMTAAGLTPEVAQVTLRASTNVSLAFEEAQKMVRLLETLEDLDDVQNVYSNADISEEVLARL